MTKLSLPAKIFVLSIIGLGAIAIATQLNQLLLADLGLTLVVSAMAAATQVLKVEGPTERSSYNISWAAYGFAFVVLGAPAATFVILVAHLAEWIKHKYPWYIQAFNIGTYAFVVCAAELAFQWIAGVRPPAGQAGILAVSTAAVAFTWLNHLIVGTVLKLARGQSFKESGVFERLPLAIDLTLFCMGAGAAFIWFVNPYAVFLAAVPLYLIYSTLRVPALERQTQTDAKTGLYNSKYFMQALESELARADRHDRPLTIVMADLDLLRNINNTYGHVAGDAALVSVANILRQHVRDYDVVARFGGEEFSILMPETTLEQARPRVEEIRAAIAAAQIEVSTSVKPLQVTMSFGIAERDGAAQKCEEILHRADLAVYHAKLSGRNRIGLSTASDYAVVVPTPAAGPAPEPPSASAPPASQPAAPQSPEGATGSPAISPPVIRRRPAWAVNAYIAAVALTALAFWAVTGQQPMAQDVWGLALFAAMVCLAEWLAIDIYVRDTSISTSAAPLLAGALLFGPGGALVLSLALAATAAVRHRSHFERFVFNASNQLIASLICVWVARVFTPDFGAAPFLQQAAVATLAGGLAYLSSTALVALAVSLSSGQVFRQVWTERFGWLGPYYLAFGVLAYALATGYLSNGAIGVVTILVPLVLLRVSQVQYIGHTQALVAQLRQGNREIEMRADQVSMLNDELLLALSRAIDMRDPDGRGHSHNVARYAALIAEELGLPPQRVELIRKAGLLHDIGKLGIPETILFKPARLSSEEYETVKRHAALGAEMVASFHTLKSLAPFIRYHHERFTGGGYPEGLSGYDIPLEARVLNVADTVEAMASDRPYHVGEKPETIIYEIQQVAGAQLDPAVVNAFLRVIAREGYSVITNSAHWSSSLAMPEPPLVWPRELIRS